MPDLFKRASSSMSATPQLPFPDDEALSAQNGNRQGNAEVILPNRSIRRRGRAGSSAGLSSSFSLPSRSYIHHAGYGSQEPVQYSSSGVREQTAELSSSFLSESELGRQFSPEKNTLDPGASSSRRHETIEERSEPVSPVGSNQDAPTGSQLTEGLRRKPPSQRTTESRQESDMRPSSLHIPSSSVPSVIISNEDGTEVTETSPLLPRQRPRSYYRTISDAEANLPADDTDDQEDDDEEYPPGTWNRVGHHYPSVRAARRRISQVPVDPRRWDFRHMVRECVYKPASMIPAVFLGLLLNLLDALSYGIILFPLGEEVFKDMGPDGVSMFYVSCIISQLVYSSGSIFKGGVGSEMIEVVPFFHKMTYLIMAQVGTDNPEALRATVITSYAMSAIITGAVFAGLGALRLGNLVNFFPHSILTGCIGGVGIFLFVTGIEVSARLDGNLEFTLPVLKKLFEKETVVLWIPPLALAIILMVLKFYRPNKWLVPAYYISITAVFYIITTAVPSISMHNLRDHGWVFEAPATGVPFYNFYSYYKWELVDWKAIVSTIPSQFALTFFGILHVPINVPNLAMTVEEDNVSINRELIMHGISNTVSGAVGSIQNYLVFVNSALFMETGGNHRLAGYMLAAATFGLWVAGPVVIGYVPVMVVGTLIYQLGIDLAQEALVSTWGKLHRLEYATILIIALVMGLYDFVVGIAIGIGLACLVYVVQTSRKNVIRHEFSGAVAESTVRRHPRARKYLRKVGRQIRVFKLSSYLFFGSIVSVEKKVRSVVDAEAFAASPIRYLILDFTHVSGIDFSAAEAFKRMNRILNKREVKMWMTGVVIGSDVYKALSDVGLFEDEGEDAAAPPKLDERLNDALEACENELLMVLANKEKAGSSDGDSSPPVDIPETSPDASDFQFNGLVGSPRRDLLYQAATTTITETAEPEQRKWQNFNQPLPLLLQAFSEMTTQTTDFWYRAVPYFEKRQFVKGQMLYTKGDKPDGFYLLQSGILRAEYYLEQGNYHENIVAGTTCGELPFFSETARTSSVIAEQDCVAWLMTPTKWEELQEKDEDVAREMLKVGMKLSMERMNTITSYMLIQAS